MSSFPEEFPRPEKGIDQSEKMRKLARVLLGSESNAPASKSPHLKMLQVAGWGSKETKRNCTDGVQKCNLRSHMRRKSCQKNAPSLHVMFRCRQAARTRPTRADVSAESIAHVTIFRFVATWRAQSTAPVTLFCFVASSRLGSRISCSSSSFAWEPALHVCMI